jgi:hypothetical protein
MVPLGKEELECMKAVKCYIITLQLHVLIVDLFSITLTNLLPLINEGDSSPRFPSSVHKVTDFMHVIT